MSRRVKVTPAIGRSRIPLALPVDFSLSLDYRVMLFSIALATLTGVAFGLVPALRATRQDLTGALKDERLAAHLAMADVFVFPSLTDTFGVVQLEALACGVPVAAYPVTGPRDVIGDNPVGVLNEDLRAACLEALNVSRAACREYALTRSWETSAR